MSLPDEQVAALLAGVRTVAVVGVSDRFTRPSFHLAAYVLDRTDWDVALVNPHVVETLGRLCVPSLALLERRPDLVVVFRAAPAWASVVDEAAAAGARLLWLPAEDPDDLATSRARAAGMDVVAGRSLKATLRAASPDQRDR